MRAIITTILFFLTLAVFGQVNDAEAFFKGSYDKAFVRKHKIKQVSIESYINGSKFLHALLEFDRKGLLTNQTSFDSNGKKTAGFTFAYDKQGGQIERKTFEYELNKSYTDTFIKTYENSKIVWEASSNLPFVTKHMYDRSGRLVQSTMFLGADTSVIARQVSIYNYDSSGKLKNMQDFFVEHPGALPVVSGNSEYIYDAVGNVVAIRREGKADCDFSYFNDGLLQSKTVTMPEEFNSMKIVDKFSYKSW